MRAYIIAINILNFVVLISFVFSFSYVFLNYTFTHTNLPDDNIPFFIHDNAADPTEKNSGRYELYWWILATGTLRILIPIALISNVLFLKFFGPGFTIFVQLIFAVVIIWEWVKFFWLLILWFPSNCKNHQFCRNFGSRRNLMAEIGDDPGKQNAVFTFEVFYTLAFAFIMLLYIAAIGNIRKIFVMTKKAKANNQLKSWRLWSNLILALILTFGLIFYFALVFLNFTFTNPKTTNTIVPPDLLINLPDSNIPYYIDDIPDPTELNSGRAELYWWFLATDTLLILIPVIELTNLVLRTFGFRSYSKLIQGSVIVLLIWQLIKTIWIATLSLSSPCAGHQFCRALGSRRDGGGNEIGDPPGVWNSTYATYVWFNIGFVVVLVLFFIVNLETSIFRKKKKAPKKLRKNKYSALSLTQGSPRTKKKRTRNKNQ